MRAKISSCTWSSRIVAIPTETLAGFLMRFQGRSCRSLIIFLSLALHKAPPTPNGTMRGRRRLVRRVPVVVAGGVAVETTAADVAPGAVAMVVVAGENYSPISSAGPLLSTGGWIPLRICVPDCPA